MVSIGLLPVAPAILVSLITFLQVRQTMTTELERQGAAVASSLNHSFEVLVEQQAPHIIQRVVANSAMIADVRRVRIVDLTRTVLASSDRPEVGTVCVSPPLQRFFDSGGLTPLDDLGERGQITVVRPLYRGRYDGLGDRGVVGAIELTLDRRAAESSAYRAALSMLGVTLGVYIVVAALTAVILRGLVVQPLRGLAAVTRAFRDGDRSQRSRLRRGDEIGQLSDAFDEMAAEVEKMVNQLEEQVAARTALLGERTAALAERTRALAELEASTAERLKLAETVRALSTPVLRVDRGVVVMPLVGSIDADRAEQIQAALLHAIERHDAGAAILDLTGVPEVDTDVASYLMRARSAAELLGCSVVLVGISANVARRIVELGIDFAGVSPCADLESGLRLARRQKR